MILKLSNKFVVKDTKTKAVISEHEFDDTKKSVKEADAAARASNEIWKQSQK